MAKGGGMKGGTGKSSSPKPANTDKRTPVPEKGGTKSDKPFGMKGGKGGGGKPY